MHGVRWCSEDLLKQETRFSSYCKIRTSSGGKESDLKKTSFSCVCAYVFCHPLFELLSFLNGECVGFGNDGYDAHNLPQPLHELNIDGA